jgi:hypothetical protein
MGISPLATEAAVTSLILNGAKLRALRHRQTVQLDMDLPAPPPSVARTGRAV